jgi:hypothetical protein
MCTLVFFFITESLDRSHPSAPNRPPLETFVGFLTAPIDKLKDAFAKFPTEEMEEEAEAETEAHPNQ